MIPKIMRKELDFTKRVIVISDIHNRIDLFKQLLKKVNFNMDDYLIIDGDFLEKGHHSSIDTFNYIMNLKENNPNVYVLMGNCDDIWIRMSITSKSAPYKDYLLNNPYSFVKQLCDDAGIIIDDSFDANKIAQKLIDLYPKMWEFINSIPHVLETSKYVFVHGGYNPFVDNYGIEAHDLMKFDNFEASNFQFDKYVVVGHWPVSNYCRDVISYNPRINSNQKIISIDGGNSIKSSGQLNALIINNEEISYEYVDELPRVEIIKDYIGNLKYQPFSIVWADSEIEILEELGEFTRIRHVSSSKIVKILSKNIYKGQNDKMYCWDSTSSHLTVYKNEVVSLVYKGLTHSLLKKNGEIGWVKNNCFK